MCRGRIINTYIILEFSDIRIKILSSWILMIGTSNVIRSQSILPISIINWYLSALNFNIAYQFKNVNKRDISLHMHSHGGCGQILSMKKGLKKLHLLAVLAPLFSQCNIDTEMAPVRYWQINEPLYFYYSNSNPILIGWIITGDGGKSWIMIIYQLNWLFSIRDL